MQHQYELTLLILLVVLLNVWRTRNPHGPRPPSYVFLIEPAANDESQSAAPTQQARGSSMIDLEHDQLPDAVHAAVQAGYILIIIRANNKSTASLYFEAWVKVLSRYHGVAVIAMVGDNFLGGRRYFRYFK